MVTILIVILIILLIGGLPACGAHQCGYWPSGIAGLVLLILLILLLLGGIGCQRDEWMDNKTSIELARGV